MHSIACTENVFSKSRKTRVACEVFLMAFYQRFEAHSLHCLGHCGDVKYRDSIKPSMQDLSRLFWGLTIAGFKFRFQASDGWKARYNEYEQRSDLHNSKSLWPRCKSTPTWSPMLSEKWLFSRQPWERMPQDKYSLQLLPFSVVKQPLPNESLPSPRHCELV